MLIKALPPSVIMSNVDALPTVSSRPANPEVELTVKDLAMLNLFGLVVPTPKFVPSNVSALPVASALVDEAYRTPFAVNDVSPVPPFVVASVPARVIAPEVAVEGVKPVVPALKVVTATPDRVLH